MYKKKVLGIVITYKETRLCKKAIKSLIGAGVDVALVFNGWSDEYNKWFDRINEYLDYVILNRENIGFCRGNNLALKLAISKGYEYSFLLNNDAWITTDCIDILLKECKDNVGMVQPKVYKAWNKDVLDTTGLVYRYGDKYSWERGLGYVVDRGQNEYDTGKYDIVCDVIGCCACAVLYNLKMIRQIGGFWEKLWSLCEDVELSWRAYNFGWKARYVPDAVAYHWRGYSINKKKDLDYLSLLWQVLGYRNWTLTLLKFGNFIQRLFTSLMWGYVGVKSCIGRMLRKNNVGGKYMWLCSLALLDSWYANYMDKYFQRLFNKLNIKISTDGFGDVYV